MQLRRLLPAALLAAVLAACGGKPAAQPPAGGASSQAAPAQGAAQGRSAAQAQAPAKLTIAVIPTQASGNFKKSMDKLAVHLQQELGMPVDLHVADDYAAVVEAMRFGRADLAFFGPFTYVVANAQSGVQAIVTQNINGKPYYKSYMIVPKDSPIPELKSNEDFVRWVKGKRFAFGDPGSTSSSLIPRVTLKRAGIDPEKDIQPNFTGKHDAVLLAVATGKADIGAIDSAIFENTLSKTMPDAYSKVRVVWKSADLYQYPWAVRKDLPQDLVKKIQDAFLKVKDPDIFQAFGADGFTLTDDAKYDDVRAAARELGVDLQAFKLK